MGEGFSLQNLEFFEFCFWPEKWSVHTCTEVSSLDLLVSGQLGIRSLIEPLIFDICFSWEMKYFC